MKKYGVLIGVVVFLGLAVFLNARINQNLKQTPLPSATLQISLSADNNIDEVQAENADYFEVFRQDRINMRDKTMECLDAIIHDERTDAETLADAQQEKLVIVSNMEMEFTVESLLKAKGFSDVAVTFHPGSVNVILKANELTDQQVAQALDIVSKETGESAANIKISPSKN